MDFTVLPIWRATDSVVNLSLDTMDTRGLSALSDLTPKYVVLSVSHTAHQKDSQRSTWLPSTQRVSVLGWFITATACLGNTIISHVPHWPRQGTLTMLKLIGSVQKWEPMRLESSACEKWSTLLLKGERVLAHNSTAVVELESHFLGCELRRLDWTALNYNEFIDQFKSAAMWKTTKNVLFC